MPSVTYDGRSFMLDGRRLWLVSGSIHYARVPRADWADRILRAKQAGLNTIETPVFWALHEPRPGVFDFEGERDIRHFIELVGDAGMWCILRPGPFVDSGWDFGGLPPWLRETEGVELRTQNQPFLEAASRYLTTLSQQVRDLQATSASGGPILLVQNESQWTCGLEALGVSYLGELHRYLREAGMTVPTVADNDLWQSIEGEIDCWSGQSNLLQAMRQLRRVRPHQPRLVARFPAGGVVMHGREPVRPPSGVSIQRRLAEILAGGGQYNIEPFCGGTNFGFAAGRLAGVAQGYLATSHDCWAPLSEAGEPGPSYGPVRRVSTFASSFSKVLSSLDPDYQPILLDPESAGGGRNGAGYSVVHARGSQGGIVFAFASDPEAGGAMGRKQAPVLMPGGETVELAFGEQAVAWCLLDVHLSGRAKLDICTFNAFALVGSTLVCFGPAGAAGVVTINGSRADLEAPKKRKGPEIIQHENVTVVLCNEEQIDETYVVGSDVLVGVGGVTRDGTPLPGATRSYLRIGQRGTVEKETAPARNGRAPRAPSLGAWEVAVQDDYAGGSSARYATINGPADLTTLGAPSGYGWYRIALKVGAARRPKVSAPGSRDRLSLFVNGKAAGVLGAGPDGGRAATLPLSRGQTQVVVLVENLGRYSSGINLEERKGLLDHLMELSPLKGVKPKIVEDEPLHPLEHHKPLWNVHEEDATLPRRLTWAFTHRKKSPIVMEVDELGAACELVLNGQPLRFLERGWGGEIVLDSETLNRGNNTLQLAPVDEFADEAEADAALKSLEKSVGLCEVSALVSEKGEWAFAKWEPPSPSAFAGVSRSQMQEVEGPAWWRCSFEVADLETPLFLDLGGMTKGQLYVNGEHLGRYWVATADGKAVGPQTRFWIPGAWLAEGRNELLLFDENGGRPSGCKLAYDPKGRPTVP